MAKLNDLTGKTIGNWKVLYRNGSTPNKASIWRCQCTLCGKEKDVAGYSLTAGVSTKCRNCVPRVTLTKPHRKERVYHIYSAMKQRCYNPNSTAYPRYGGRGITVCDEWKDSPDAFIEWAYSNGYADNLTIERIDYNKPYCPSNCCWIPDKDQAKNRSTVLNVKYLGDEYTLRDACLLAGLNYDSVRQRRYKHRISAQEAFDHFL